MVAYNSSESEREYHAHHVDQMIRMALESCVRSLPKESRSYEEAKRQLVRLIDRAIADAEEDRKEFGI
jgi:hypothetical protein